MADTIEIIQGTATTVEVAGPTGPQGPAGAAGATGAQGPQGVPGTGLEVLTTQGDLLYQGASTGQRLPIGSTGQVLKVAGGIPAWGAESGAVSSVAGRTGAVTLAVADVTNAVATSDARLSDARTPLSHTHEAGQILMTEAEIGPVLAGGFTEEGGGVNGIYWPTDLTLNGAIVYKLNRTYGMFFENSRWHIYENSPITANIVASSDNDNASYPHLSAWSADVVAATLGHFSEKVSQQFIFVGDNLKVGSTSGLPLKTGSGGTVEASAFGTGAGQFAEGNHSHGNLTNAGAIGTTANLPLRTGTNGVIEAGSFGTAAGSFCAGDDVRLSDARTPSSTLAHKASHATGGTDALAPSDIGAQSIFTTQTVVITADTTLTAGRSINYRLQNYGGGPFNLTLPTSNNQVGDVIVARVSGTFLSDTTIRQALHDGTGGGPQFTTFSTLKANSEDQYRFLKTTSEDFGGWELVRVDSHPAARITSGTLLHERGGLETDVSAYNGLLKIASGSTSAVTVTSAGEALLDDADAAAQRVTMGAAASGSITSSGLTQSTARILGRTSSSTGSIEEIQIGSGLSLSAGELSSTVSAGIPATLLDAKGDLIVASAADTAARLAVGGTNGHVLTVDSTETLGVKWAAAAGGVTAVGASTADVLSVSGSDLVADDPNADRIVFWDDSESKWRYLEAGSGLSISGTTMTATASGGSKTYAVFTAEHNQPPATSFATLDTRNSIAVLDFDAATDESAVFVGIIPEGASLGSGLKVFIHWMATTATSGNCRWGVQFEKSGTDLDSDSFDTATEAHSAANGTSGIETVTEITATAIDSLAAGDRFRLKVFRNADDATNDTMTGDAELVAVEIRSAA